VRVAPAQIDCVLGDTEENLRKAKEVVVEAKNRGADLTVFPELSLSEYALGELGDDVAIEAQSEPIISLAEVAGEMGVVVGFCEEGRGFQTYNSAAYLEGGVLGHLHRKLYLPNYRIYEERKHYNPGQNMRAFGTRFGPMAILICNDAWQTFLPFIAIQDGAQVLIIPPPAALTPIPSCWTRGATGVGSPASTPACSSATSFSSIASENKTTWSSGDTRTSSIPGGRSWLKGRSTRRP
jgi:predicted amidohydrolase